MKSGPGLWSRGGGKRHEVANRERGVRARAHLARVRERERRQLERRERERDRARRLQGAPDPRPRIRRAALFALSGAIGVALASLLGEPALRWLGPDFAAVETIAVQGQVRLSPEAVASATGVAPGTPLASVDPVDVQTRLRGVPWIRDAHVLRLPPSTLLVAVRERAPRAVLLPRTAGQPVRLVDAEGTPFASGPVADVLPRLVGGDELPSGTPDPLLATALELLEGLERAGAGSLADDQGQLALHLPVGDSPEGWVLRGAAEVVLGRDALEDRFGRLSELLRSSALATGGTEGPLRIDLRFADQAVLSQVGAHERG